MNAEDLLAHFERISEAPDAIARLRRFILDLAVRGKLVEQDPNDAKTQGFKKQNETPTPFDLPSNWIWVQIGEQLDLINGMAFKATDWQVTGLRIVRIQNLNNPDAQFNCCDPDIARERSLIDDGSLLISWSGTPGTSFGAFIWERGPAVLNQHIFRCDFKTQSFNVLFLRLAINGRLDEMISKAHGGAGLQHITKGKLEALPIPLPPLAEQHRIVAKVDELMALCDQLEKSRLEREQSRKCLGAATLQRLNQPDEDPTSFRNDASFALQVLPSISTTPAQIKQLRQTILNLAVRGKLVEQDPEDEPADELLRFITRHKSSSSQASSHESPLPFDLPTGWTHATLRTLVVSSSSGWSPKTLDTPRDGNEWGILKVSAVSWDQFRPEANKQVLPGTQPRPQAIVRKGDFLISRANTAELVARAVVVESEPVNLMMSDKIVRLEIVELCEPKYILINNNYSSFSRRYYAERATGVSPSMKNVTRDVILDLPVPLPPLAEQHRIVAKVDELMGLCDQLEQQLSHVDQQRRRLLEAVLDQALSPMLAES